MTATGTPATAVRLAIVTILATLVGACVMARKRLTVVSVVGPSMEPSLHHGDRWLALRQPSPGLLRRDRVVVAQCRLPESDRATTIVKRVAHLGGESVDQVVHSVPVHPYWQLDGATIRGVLPPSTVYLASDNPPAIDSSDLGPVPIDDVEAILWWPMSRAANGVAAGR